MRIQRQGTAITLDQVDYLRKVLARFGFVNQKHAATPLLSSFKPEANTSSPDLLIKQEYQEKVGSLLYLMIGTRPDISYAITKMSQFVANLSKRHLDAVNHICCYLMGTADYKLIYGNIPEGLIAYANADWAGAKTRQSNTSNVIFIRGAAVSWNSRAQKTVMLSSTEAEYMACLLSFVPPPSAIG